MKICNRVLSALVLAAFIAAPSFAQGTNVTGTWAFTVTTDQGSGNPTLTFKQEGEKAHRQVRRAAGRGRPHRHGEGHGHQLHLHARRAGPAGAGHLRRHGGEGLHEGHHEHRGMVNGTFTGTKNK